MTKSPNKLLHSSLTGASYLLSLQLFSRLITFLINQLLYRFVTPAIYGIASIDFELLLSTVLFLSREGFRCALLRSNVYDSNEKAEDGESQKFVNLCYLPIPIGFFMAFILILRHYFFDGSNTNSTIFYNISFSLYLIAAILELSTEPIYILSSNQLNFKLRTTVEGTAVFLRCVTLFSLNLILYYYFDETIAKQNSILTFGIAQLIYSISLFFGYFKGFCKNNSLPYPKILIDETTGKVDLFNKDLYNLSITLSLQSIVKHILTEGDKLLLTLLSDENEKGYYSSAANYGSLIARIIFQPVEESSRILYSKLLKPQKVSSKEKESNYLIDWDCVILASSLLLTSLKFQVLLGLFFLFIIPHYTSALYSLLGKSWAGSNAANILSIYCAYIPIMGVNGLTEAFVQSVAPTTQLNGLSYAMVAFTAIFLSVGYMANSVLGIPSYAIILANSVNMLLRITWSISFAKNYFNDLAIKYRRKSPFNVIQILPNFKVILIFFIASYFCYLSRISVNGNTLIGLIIHIIIGGISTLVILCIVYFTEKEFITALISIIKSKKD